MKDIGWRVGQRFVVGFEGLTASADVEAAEARVRGLQERFLADYRDPDPKDARLAAGRGEHRARAESIAAGSGLRA